MDFITYVAKSQAQQCTLQFKGFEKYLYVIKGLLKNNLSGFQELFDNYFFLMNWIIVQATKCQQIVKKFWEPKETSSGGDCLFTVSKSKDPASHMLHRQKCISIMNLIYLKVSKITVLDAVMLYYWITSSIINV